MSQLKESLHVLPQSLSQLVQYSLDRLCSLYRGMLGLRWALAALTVSTTGKMSPGDDFYVIFIIIFNKVWSPSIVYSELL